MECWEADVQSAASTWQVTNGGVRQWINSCSKYGDAAPAFEDGGS